MCACVRVCTRVWSCGGWKGDRNFSRHHRRRRRRIVSAPVIAARFSSVLSRVRARDTRWNRFFSFFHYYQDNTRIWPHTLRRTVFHCRVPFAFCYLFSVSRESSYRCRVTSVASVSRLATRWTNHRYRHGKQKTQRKKKVTRTFYNNTYGLIMWGPIMQCRAREWIFSYGLP